MLNYLFFFFFLRLGALGFFTIQSDEAPGNLGLRDIIVALDWVQEYIADYGGDKDQVTLFGHSAGSMAISAIMTYQEAGFQRAILQSGTLIRPFFFQLEKVNMTQRNLEFAELVGCSSNINVTLTLNCLISKPVEDLVAASNLWPVHTLWEPVIDNMVSDPILPLSPYEAFTSGKFKQSIDIIVGSASGDGIAQLGRNILNTDIAESSYENLQENFQTVAPELMMGSQVADDQDIILAERLRYFYAGERLLNSSVDLEMVRLMSDNMYQAGGTFILNIMSLLQISNNVYHYFFNYVGTVSNAERWFNIHRPELGACHGDELLYLIPDKSVDALVTETDRAISDLLVKFWTNFAKSGNPNNDDGSPETWTQYSAGQEYLSIGEQTVMQYLEADRLRDSFWQTVFSKPRSDSTSAGLIQGSTLTSIHGTCIRSYQGIPYAQAPLGHLRFKDPVPLDTWQGTLDATKLKPACMQVLSPAYDLLPMSEDCLYLNIYRPCTEEQDLPVVVWIHGGGLVRGSGGTHLYGPEFLIDSNIILVTLNYRLIPFSFVSLESEAMPGNQGLKDQRLALKWVQDHIESLGGSKSAVTIYGESAGSRRF